MKEFFENLKQIRESKNISLEEISKRSRLPLKYLIDIENGTLENLPKGYDRIFFKRYLKEIGEDKEEIWKDFNLFFGTGTLEKDVPYSSDAKKIEKPENIEIQEEEKEKPSENGKKTTFIEELKLQLNLDKLYKYFWIIITVVVVGIIGYFAYQQYLFVKNRTPEVKEVTVSDYIYEMQRQDSILTQQLTENTEIGTDSTGSLRVELHSVERTWIREIRDQRDTTDYILIPGLRRKIEANQSVDLMLGRADGVNIWLNDDSLGVMGESDEVIIRLLLTNKGIEEKRVKKVTPKVLDTSSVTT